MYYLIKHNVVGVLLIILFVFSINTNNTGLCVASWLVSGAYALTIGSGGFWKIFKSDPSTLFGGFNTLWRIILIIACIISGAFALIVLVIVEWVDYLQEIEED